MATGWRRQRNKEMESSSLSAVSGGLWNNPRPGPYSRETQNMLKLMMDEAKLSNLQRKQINQCLKNGTSLQLACKPTAPALPTQPKSSKPVHRGLTGRPLRRSAESCRSGDSYTREQFRPGPRRDLDKEKMKLQNIMALGEEDPLALKASKNVPARENPAEAEQRDLFQEVVNDIEERRQFLEDMASLGQEKQYMDIINTEISQKIRELEVLDKALSPKKDAAACEEKELTMKQKTENRNLPESYKGEETLP